MNKNPSFTPQESEESFYENSECYNNEANYEDDLWTDQIKGADFCGAHRYKIFQTFFE